MATEEKEQTAAEQQPAEEAPVGEKPAEQNPPKPPKPPKQREILLPILTILFVLVGIAELGLWTITGLSLFRSSQARRAYEAQQAGLQTGTEQPLGASYSGPGLIIENGEVVWRRADELTQNGTFSGQNMIQGTETGTGSQTIDPALKTPYPPPPWSKPDTEAQTPAST